MRGLKKLFVDSSSFIRRENCELVLFLVQSECVCISILTLTLSGIG